MKPLTHDSEAARSYDSKPWQQEMLAQVTREILSHLEWIGVDWVKEQQPENTGKDHPTKTVRVLDYACGPGTVTRVGTLNAPSDQVSETLTSTGTGTPRHAVPWH